MENGALHGGDLEVRRSPDGLTTLRGRFPYRATATLSDGGRTGRPRKERFAPRAFSYRIDRPEEDIHLLVGHRFDKPLASRRTGTLDVADDDAAVTFMARIAPEVAETSHGRDALALLRSGLAVGLSPGFRLPPKRAVAEPERLEEEPHNASRGMHGAIIRTVVAALLYELSLVTMPAYPDSMVDEARAWRMNVCTPSYALWRWRA